MRLGVDIGATGVKLALVQVDDAGQARVIRRSIIKQAQAGRDGDALVELLCQATVALAGDDMDAITAVGVGVAGVLDAKSGSVLESPNMPWLDGFPLAASLNTALDVPVRVDNDANCICLGEFSAGAGRDISDLACLALGTGVGGGLVLAGRLHRGSRGRAAELGHLCVDPAGPPCGCGGRGCLEQFASQTGLVAMMRRVGLIEPGQQSAKDWIITLFDQADGGDRRAMALVQGAGGALGEAIANLVTVLPLSVVIIAGGIAARLDALRPTLTATLQRRLGSVHGAAIEVREGTLGNDAGCLGAAALFEQS